MTQTAQATQATQSRPAQMGFGRRGLGMGAPVEKPKHGKQTLRRLLAYFKPQRGLVLLLFLIVTTGVILQVAAPSLLSRAIDSITAGWPR